MVMFEDRDNMYFSTAHKDRLWRRQVLSGKYEQDNSSCYFCFLVPLALLIDFWCLLVICIDFNIGLLLCNFVELQIVMFFFFRPFLTMRDTGQVVMVLAFLVLLLCLWVLKIRYLEVKYIFKEWLFSSSYDSCVGFWWKWNHFESPCLHWWVVG